MKVAGSLATLTGRIAVVLAEEAPLHGFVRDWRDRRWVSSGPESPG